MSYSSVCVFLFREYVTFVATAFCRRSSFEVPEEMLRYSMGGKIFEDLVCRDNETETLFRYLLNQEHKACSLVTDKGFH